jgi:hypothetical protein
MKHRGRKCFGGFLAVALSYISITGLVTHLTNHSYPEERVENAKWIETSNSWADKQLCRWLGMCGTAHLNRNSWTWDDVDDDLPPTLPDWKHFWHSDEEDPDQWSPEEKATREIPQYVFDHAPYVHLFSGEEFWPCDLAEHLVHVHPYENYTKIKNIDHELNLTNLHELNDYPGGVHGRFVYLQSKDNVEERPDWLRGDDNIPDIPDLHFDDDEDAIWAEDEAVFDQSAASAQLPPSLEHDNVDTEDLSWWPAELTPSENGRCGRNTGYTCQGSGFGKCCSIYGWCGGGDDFCGQACDPLGGACDDPFEPIPKPHPDLRRRQLQEMSKKYQPNEAGRSSAPAFLIVVPKGNGVVDAFWFFFYSFNLGQKVFRVRFGNHVGDWEHTLIRFKHGKPFAAFLSEHDFGSAYSWHALEKYVASSDGSGRMIGTWSNDTAARVATRPVLYSAVGTHAMYPTPGIHPYILPYGILHDQTDRGPVWDPTLNLHSFTWSADDKKLRASTLNPKLPTSWFHFGGHWGDKYYPLSDPRQYRFAGQYHYVNGPLGPRYKNLGRKQVCLSKRCRIRNWVEDSRIRRLPPEEDVEPGGLPGGNVTEPDVA